MLTAREALERLREGNARYRAAASEHTALTSQQRREDLVSGQEPYAVVLGCADSRVPVTTIFDQGLGDLFVIRVAGNIVASSQLGSVEFAADHFGTRLVVVLGHTGCGAVKATIEQLRKKPEHQSRGLQAIVHRVRPAVDLLLEGELADDPAALLRQAVRDNVRASVKQLRFGSEILSPLIRDDGLRVIGAEYDLATGEVDFFDGMDALDG